MFARGLEDESRYHRQLDRLVARARGRRIANLEHAGVRLSQILDDRERVVRLLSRAVADAAYRPSSIRATRTHLAGKVREVARASAIDLVVNGVVAELLSEIVEPTLSSCVYSYRRGRSAWQAVRWLASLARDHRRSHPEPKSRGLYVLRSDVASYTDSIPIDDGAIVWSEVRELVGDRHFDMVRALMGAPGRERGVLFGLPTTNIVGNLYLAPLDRALETQGGYARFGDDLLFIHEKPERVRDAKVTLERILAERGLRANEKKMRIFFWNGAPRPSAVWPEAEPARIVPFLGAAVRFDATVALVNEKWRVMLRDVHGRIWRTARLLVDESKKTRARTLVRIVNDAFNPRSELALAHAPLVLDLVSDRSQLAALDYLLALWVAEASSGRRGPRAFRDVPWKWLRREAKLASRVVVRNSPSRR